MNIPEVNAGVTDRNRAQTSRLRKLLGYEWVVSRLRDDVVVTNNKIGARHDVRLCHGSFALDQVVGMLKAEGARFRIEQYSKHAYWWHALWVFDDSRPHDLTAAMDALIKVLETKKGETT
jgi:hypothetical protein